MKSGRLIVAAATVLGAACSTSNYDALAGCFDVEISAWQPPIDGPPFDLVPSQIQLVADSTEWPFPIEGRAALPNLDPDYGYLVGSWFVAAGDSVRVVWTAFSSPKMGFFVRGTSQDVLEGDAVAYSLGQPRSRAEAHVILTRSSCSSARVSREGTPIDGQWHLVSTFNAYADTLSAAVGDEVLTLSRGRFEWRLAGGVIHAGSFAATDRPFVSALNEPGGWSQFSYWPDRPEFPFTFVHQLRGDSLLLRTTIDDGTSYTFVRGDAAQ